MKRILGPFPICLGIAVPGPGGNGTVYWLLCYSHTFPLSFRRTHVTCFGVIWICNDRKQDKQGSAFSLAFLTKACALKGAFPILLGFFPRFLAMYLDVSLHSLLPLFLHFSNLMSILLISGYAFFISCSAHILFTHLIFTLYSPETASLFRVPLSPPFIINVVPFLFFLDFRRHAVRELDSTASILLCYSSPALLRLIKARTSTN